MRTALGLLAVAACWTASPAPTVTSSPRVVRPSSDPCAPGPHDREPVFGEIVDHDDRCPTLPSECLEGFDFQDNDGCPDPPPPEIEFARGSAVVPPEASDVLDRVATDARHLGRGVRLAVTGDRWPEEAEPLARARADAIVAALVRRCVDRTRIQAADDDLPESFEGRDPPPNRAVITARGCR